MNAFAQKQNPTHVLPNVISSKTKPLARHAVHPIMDLQRTIGNQAVLRLLHENAEGGHGRSETSTLTPFAQNLRPIAVSSKSPAGLQAKLKLNTPGDRYEQEADRVAEEVASMRRPRLQRASAWGGGCQECGNEKAFDEHLHPTRVRPDDSGGMAAPAILDDVLPSSGQPLDTGTRGFMESRFGHDFKRVRVHTDARAAESAQAIDALAYTVGSHVVFGTGQYAPGTSAGQKLLAHELTHVVQQDSGGFAGPLSRPAAPHVQGPAPGNPGVVQRNGGRGDRAGRDDRQKGRETRTVREQGEDSRRDRPEGGRDRRRTELGDFDSDWAGRAILERYLSGEGDWKIADDPAWTEYMKHSDLLRDQLKTRVEIAAIQLAAKGKDGSLPVSQRFHAELENGEGIIGYQYLHGTNKNVGDFLIAGSGLVEHVYGATQMDAKETVPPSTMINLKLRYVWNDIIDPNPEYGTDTIKSIFAEIITLGEAESYNISIAWSDECFVNIPEEGDPTMIGYPGD